MKQPEKIPSFAADPDAALASYHELGYHIEQNVWTDNECEDIIGASENLSSYKDDTLVPAMQAHRQEPRFLQALENPKIVKIMELLVSGSVSALQSEFFFCPPGTTGFALHQDNYFVEAKPQVFASAWSPMQDVTPEMGGLIVYPGSHKEPILPVERLSDGDQSDRRQTSQDPNATREQVAVPAGYEPVHVSVSKGSTLLIHGQLIHGSNKNCSEQWRRVLLTTYIRSGEPFRPGSYAARAEVDVYGRKSGKLFSLPVTIRNPGANSEDIFRHEKS